ncbi:ImpA family type VI secretion system protein [Cupriavidus sp. 2MCAB6]|uniref:type VI secretion system protein TssA n=1 Tax=Cupriavidus sp. 2MCAB6 TaxID=3232981 RepID=UPI003F92E278
MTAKSKITPSANTSTRFPELMEAITKEKPCGDDLEYDPEFVVLLAKAAPKPDAQYGDFVSAPEAVSWTELERDCRRLLLRTRDIRILVLLLRCRARMDHAAGLRDGLALLAQLLTKWPDAIHPQRVVEGEADLALRANALAALADPAGLMQDVRDLPIMANGALRLQIRDVERSLAVPRTPDALPSESVRQQLKDMRVAHSATLVALEEAAGIASAIDAWASDNLPDERPDLQPLLKLLGTVANTAEPAIAPAVAEPNAMPSAELHPESVADVWNGNGTAAIAEVTTTAPRSADFPVDRGAALSGIRAARLWFEHHEPSSPVALLLKQAERLTGKRFDEVFQAIPADLVERWAQDAS